MCLFLGISRFISQATQAISKLEFLANQIRKNEKDIDAKLHFLEMANLFKFPAREKISDLPGTM